MPGPKVFEEGTVTMVIGPDGTSVYAGTHEIRTFRSVRVTVQENQSADFEIEFKRSSDAGSSLQIEEEVRTISAIPWIRVNR